MLRPELFVFEGDQVINPVQPQLFHGSDTCDAPFNMQAAGSIRINLLVVQLTGTVKVDDKHMSAGTLIGFCSALKIPRTLNTKSFTTVVFRHRSRNERATKMLG